MFPLPDRLPAEVQRAYRAFELAESNLMAYKERQDEPPDRVTKSYYRMRKILLDAIFAERVLPEEVVSQYAARAGLHAPSWSEVRAYVERNPVPFTNPPIRKFHFLYGSAEDGADGYGHGHYVLLIDESGKPVRMQLHREIDTNVSMIA